MPYWAVSMGESPSLLFLLYAICCVAPHSPFLKRHNMSTFQLIYEIEADDIIQVIAIALQSYELTGIEPTLIKTEAESIAWDRQEMIRAITK